MDLAYEIHPGEDLHDGLTFEMFLDKVKGHPRANMLYDPSHYVLQCLDYLEHIDIYHDRIKAFHVKDAEFRPTGRSGFMAGTGLEEPRRTLPQRGRRPGRLQAGLHELTQYGYASWAVLEWECCIKDSAQGAAEGAQFIKSMLIDTPQKAFDDFAGSAADDESNRKILGLT